MQQPVATGSTVQLEEIASRFSQVDISREENLVLQKKVESSFPHRPGFGNAGTPVNIVANHFLLTYTLEGDVFHYDISAGEKDKPFPQGGVPPKDLAKGIIDLLVRAIEAEIPRTKVATDFRKNMYAVQRLPFAEKKYENLKLIKEGREREFFCIVKESNPCAIRMTQLNELFRGQLNYTPYDCIQALDIALRHTASMRFTMVGRSLYSDSGSRHLPEGADLWFGYHQSLRATQSGLVVNLDLAATAFVSSMPVMDYLCDILGVANIPNQLTNFQLSKFTKAIRGVKIYTSHTKQQKRSYRVNGLSSNSALQTFFDDENGVKTSVAAYFNSKYKKLQFPNLPCLHVGALQKKIYIPMELCHTIKGQKTPRKATDKQVAEMIKSTCTTPSDRKRLIEGKFQEAQYGSDDLLKKFQMQVKPGMIKLKGRVLPEPQIQYGNNKIERPQNGTWNMRGKQLYLGANLKSWSIINRCDRRCDMRSIEHFFKQVMKQACEMGLKVPMKLPPIISQSNQRESVRSQFGKALDAARKMFGIPPQIVWMIQPSADAYAYGELKRSSDSEFGVVSQCMLQQHIAKANPQYIANILLKVNAKLGGKNCITSSPLPKVCEVPTIMFGADVTHPSPMDVTRPSIAAVVASLDIQCVKFAAAIRQQGHRVEQIEDLKGMASELLIRFYQQNQGRKPARIVFYRDGVSEGQFAHVLAHEVSAIREACRMLEKDYMPKITFIIVQKRHNTRLFVENPRDADRSGNVKAGTVVDTSICHPMEHDFYLMSHAGLKGTSRPCHYHVVLDEVGFTADELQKLTYNLCYTYARCTRSVSIVPCAYYSHLLAFRARFYMSDGSETASISSSQSGKTTSMEKMVDVHPNLKNIMFYV